MYPLFTFRPPNNLQSCKIGKKFIVSYFSSDRHITGRVETDRKAVIKIRGSYSKLVIYCYVLLKEIRSYHESI